MRKLFVIALLSISASSFADFIHPMDFNGSEAQKKRVVKIIQDRVEKDYCGAVDMCQASILRMMENQSMSAFKQLTAATNRAILNRVINDYCGIVDMCSYSMINMMYQQNLQASKSRLSWK